MVLVPANHIPVSTETYEFKSQHKTKKSYKCCCTAVDHLKANSRLFDKIANYFLFIIYDIFEARFKVDTRFKHTATAAQ